MRLLAMLLWSQAACRFRREGEEMFFPHRVPMWMQVLEQGRLLLRASHVRGRACVVVRPTAVRSHLAKYR